MLARTHILWDTSWSMAKEKKLTVSEFARIGGKARARKLTPEQRRASARKAARARWEREKKARVKQEGSGC
jgi:hypothetical protein